MLIIKIITDYVNHARAAQEHRLDGVLLEPGPQVRREQPDCGERTLDADLRRRERSERKVTGPNHSGLGRILVLVGCLSTLYSTLQAQKHRVYNQLGVVYHRQLQKYPFRVSESLKIETECQRDATKCPAIGCPTITQPCSKMGWDDVPHIPFCLKKSTEIGKVGLLGAPVCTSY